MTMHPNRIKRLVGEIQTTFKTDPTFAVVPGRRRFPKMKVEDIEPLCDAFPAGALMIPWVSNNRIQFIVFSLNPAAGFNRFREMFYTAVGEHRDDPDAHKVVDNTRTMIEKAFDIVLPDAGPVR